MSKRIFPNGRIALGLPITLALVAALAAQVSYAATPPVPMSGNARPVIEQFLISQSAGLPGKVSITVDTPTSGPLPPCDLPEPFLPSGARLWGRVSVGVKCSSNQPWTRYVSAYISVIGPYYVAARPINMGQTLVAADVAVREGDLTTLPGSVVVNPGQLNGMIASNQIASGAPLRRELLRSPVVVKQGQNIKVVSQGTGFVVNAEGKAMADAAIGAVVQVKMQGGYILSGLVRPDGVVERPN